MPIGSIMGVTVSPIFVSDYTEGKEEEGMKEIERLMMVHALVVLGLNLPIVFFKEAPEFYPSRAALISKAKETFDLKAETVELLKNKNYLVFVVVFSLVYSVYSALGAIINNLIEPYGFTNQDTSVIAICLVIAGILSSVATGLLLDTYQKYLKTVRILTFFTFVGIASTNYTATSRSLPLFIMSAIFLGIFLLPELSVGMSFAVEITHPVSEAASNGILLMISQLLSVIIAIAGTIIADIYPLYAVWMFMGQITVAFLASLFLVEDLRRLKMEN